MLSPLFFILQIRTGSSRLPEKMLIPFFNNKTIPELIIDRLLSNGIPEQNIIIATTKKPADDKILDILKNKGCLIFRGDENNVLKRFIDAATQFNAEHFFRICADNPFLNFGFISEIIQNIEIEKTDYASYYLNRETPGIKTHFGLFAEYTTLKTLKNVASRTTFKKNLEHITPYIYEHPNEFNIKKIQMPEILLNNQWLRLTIDTREDFEMAQTVFNKTKNPENIEELIQGAKAEGFKDRMQKVIQEQTK